MTLYPLSPIDHVFVGPGSYPIEFVFYFPNGLPSQSIAAKLQESWQKLAYAAPILKSQIQYSESKCFFKPTADQTQIPTIEWVHHRGSVHPKTFSNPYSLINSVVTKPNEPLAKIKITEGTDGAVLGFSLSHAIADGFTYFMMLSILAQLTRNPNTPIPPMDHDRLRLWNLVTAKTSQKILGFSNCEKRIDIGRNEIHYHSEHYSKDRLKGIFDLYSASTKRLSTNDMLCAELWRDFTSKWDQHKSEDLAFVAPVDFRRILPDFPKNYAGNAVVLARVDKTRRELLSEDRIVTANSIRQSIQSIDPSYIVDSVTALASKVADDQYGGLGTIHIVDPKGGLLITNLTRLAFDSLDFGTGSPSYCRPLTPGRRLIVLVSDGDDGVVAHVHA